MSKTVFWSWQSDLPDATTKNFIKDALAQALVDVADELELETADRLELDHDTKGEPGLVEIVSTILKKIDDCQIFVADITPVAEIKTDAATKKIPNPNVLIELGYAIREVGPQRVITVANLAFGGKPEELPFDLRHRRGAITYRLESAKDPTIKKIRQDLIKQLVTALKTNLGVPRESQLMRNPMPELLVEVTKDIPTVFLIQQVVQLDDVPSLDDVMSATPLRTKGQQNGAASPFDVFRSKPIEIFQRQRVKPFGEWTGDELEGYNRRVQRYYDNYETYLEELKEYRLLRQRAVSIRLAIVNAGTRPATDVSTKVTFPHGVLVYENDDLPKAPDQPAPPSLPPYGSGIGTILQSTYDYMSLSTTLPRIADDHRSIVLQTDKIQHGFQWQFREFTIVMSTQADIRSFGVSYQAAADELPRQTTGNLNFEVQQAE